MFRNREHAGLVLAERLMGEPMDHPLVIAIPRGGAVVGAALARRLGAEFDVLPVGRLYARCTGAVGEAELGAVAGDGIEHLVPGAVEAHGVTAECLKAERVFLAAELDRRTEMYRRVRPAAEVRGRTAILVDDGVATGATILAALKALRARRPGRVIAAMPVVPKERIDQIAAACDRLVAVFTPDAPHTLERHFADFAPVDEQAVLDRLAHHLRTHAAGPEAGACVAGGRA